MLVRKSTVSGRRRGWGPLIFVLSAAACSTPVPADSVVTAEYLGEFVAAPGEGGVDDPVNGGLVTLGGETAFAAAGQRWVLEGIGFLLHGRSISDQIGDLNVVSNIAGASAARVARLTAATEFRGVDVEFGLFDVDRHFMGMEAAAGLTNSGFGAFATATANLPLATYPLPGLGVAAHVTLAEGISLHSALMDGDVGTALRRGTFGLDSSGPAGVLWINQLDATLGPAAETTVMAGFAAHSGVFERRDGRGNESGNGFAYLGLAQRVRPFGRPADAFLRVSSAPFRDRNQVVWQVDTGFTVAGVVPGMSDRISGGLLFTEISDAAGGTATPDEWVAEISYSVDIGPHLYVQPAVQHVRGLADPERDAATVLLMRVGLHLERAL